MPKTANVSLPRIGAAGEKSKVTLLLDADLARELDSYREAYAAAYGEQVEAETIIPHMLRSFMQADRSFKGWKRAKSTGS